MTMLRQLLPATMFVFTLTGAAWSQSIPYDGNQMFAGCKSTNPGGLWNEGFRLGYLQGATDALSNQRVICIPQGVEYQRLEGIVVNWLRNHPEKRHLGAVWIVADAIKESFPCPAP